MALTLETIEALAPDQSSLAAAHKLLKPGSWPTLSVGEGLAWGECLGSGSTPYRVVISEADSGYKCSCPSRKFPCKHSLALMWMRAQGQATFAPAEVPDWVKDWLSRRRGPAAAPATPAPENPVPGAAPVAADAARPSWVQAETAEAVADPKSQMRSATARERSRLERQAAVAAGLEELDLWLTDQIGGGMAAFVPQCGRECRAIAKRLVDAKAPALAARLEGLPTRLFTLSEPLRPLAATQELGQVHLIGQAYRRQESLMPELAPDIRQAVGFTVSRDALLADASALRVEGHWRVVATLSEVQPDRLRRTETWLWHENGEESRPAVLLDFVPVSSGGGATSGYRTGDRVFAELVFYPSVLPLRAQIGRALGETRSVTDDVEFPNLSLTQSFAGYQAALGQLPWLAQWPLTFVASTVRLAGDQLFLTDPEGSLALPLAKARSSRALPLAPLGPIDGFGVWDGYDFTLCWAQTPLGRWVAS